MSEILGTLFKYVLGLLGIVGVVVLLYYALSSNSVSAEVSNITTTEGNLAGLYSGSTANAGTTSLTNAVAIAASAVPAAMVSGTKIINQWQGAVTLSGDAGGDIIISEAGLPQAACAKIITAVPSYSSLTVNGGTALTAPVDPGTSVAQCKSGTANTVAFTFGRS